MTSSRYVKIALGLAALVIVLLAVREVQAIAAPVFLAINLVIIVYPVQYWMMRRGCPGFIAAMITVIVVLMLLVAFFGLTTWAIAELVVVMPSYAPELAQLFRTSVDWLAEQGVTPQVIEKRVQDIDANSIMSTVGTLFSNATFVLTLLTTIIMAVFFVAMDSMSVHDRLRALGASKPAVSTALSAFAVGVRRYWVVATVFGLIVAALDVVALQIIGVPLALVWGVLAFVTNYIPNVGFVIGLVPPAIMALVSQDWQAMVWVIVSYTLLNFVIQSIIQPKFTGQSVGVTPFISFLSVLFWYWVLGGLGALLALPATLLLKALLIDSDPKARWINMLISSDLRTGSGLPRQSTRRGEDTTSRHPHGQRNTRTVVVALSGSGHAAAQTAAQTATAPTPAPGLEPAPAAEDTPTPEASLKPERN